MTKNKNKNKSSCVWQLKTRKAHLYWMAYRRWLIIIILHLCRNYVSYILKSGEPLPGSQPGQFYSPNPIPLATLDNVWRHLRLSQLEECSWHLASRSQGAPSHPTTHRATPPNKESPSTQCYQCCGKHMHVHLQGPELPQLQEELRGPVLTNSTILQLHRGNQVSYSGWTKG